jgi:hypothetical protein
MTTGSGCSWSASTAYSWIHTTSSGSGNGTVNYTYDANASTSSRSGTITAGGQTFTITQAGTTSTTVMLPGAINYIRQIGISDMHPASSSSAAFNSSAACGPCSAVMILTYYNRLTAHPMIGQSGVNNNFSWYVAPIDQNGNPSSTAYTYTNFPFNVGIPDPAGQVNYGAHGFLIQDINVGTAWPRAVQYFWKHGLWATADYAPTETKVRAEIDAGRPVLISTDLQAADGVSTNHHIMVIRGYNSTQLIAADPWVRAADLQNRDSYPYTWSALHWGGNQKWIAKTISPVTAGGRVRAAASFNIRPAPNANTGTYPMSTVGDLGTVSLDTSMNSTFWNADGYTWVKVAWDSGQTGWSAIGSSDTLWIEPVGTGVCTYSLSPTSASSSASSGSGSFSVTAGSGCSWSASTAHSWIHTTSSGSGNGTVSYTYDANTSTSSRSGTITAGGQTFTLTQAGTVSTPAITSPSPGSTLSSSSATFQWSSGTSVTEFFFYVGTSLGTNDLYGQSQGLNQSVTVNNLPVNGSTLYVRLWWQIAGLWYTADYTYTAATSCSYGISPSSASPSASSGSGSFSMTAGSGCSWSASTAYSWIHTTSSGSGNGTVNYTYDANTSTSSRSGTIMAGGQTFTITQAGVPCSYSISPTSASPNASSGSGSFSMTAGSGCSWSASTAYSWIHTTSSGSGNGTVSYTHDANTSTSSRSGTITAGGQAFTITQAGVSCSYSISPSSASPGASSGSGSFSMTAGSGCSWSASTAYGWIQTSSSGSGNGTVNYTYDANTSASSRSGTITAGGQTFTITQAGAVATPSITSPSPGSTLASSSTTFQWTSAAGVTNFYLSVGTSLGGFDIYGQYLGLDLSTPVTALPTDGSTLYVRLYWATTAGWQSADYTYTAATIQPPPNDTFANRIAINGSGGTATGSNTNATKQTGEPNHADNTGGKSVWWTWTAASNGTATVDTIGSSFDTLLAIYTGNSVNNLTLVAADDDGGGSLSSKTNFNAVAGTAYQIAVDGYNGASGNILLHVAFVPSGSLPTFTGVGGGPLQPPNNGQFQMEVHTTQAQVIVQASTNLVQWTDAATLNVVNGKAAFVDGNAGANANRFYRLKP